MDKPIRAIVFLVAGTAFMELLDGTAIVTALPRMGHQFGVSAVSMNIGITAYLLAVAVCLPASGWAAERYGVRRVFACGVGLFTLASLFCALSQGLGGFVGARVLHKALAAARWSLSGAWRCCGSRRSISWCRPSAPLSGRV